jgi:putative DNA methylase
MGLCLSNPHGCEERKHPVVSTFILSSKVGREAYVEPVIEGDKYRFTIKVGMPPEFAKRGTKLTRGANFRCLMSNSPIDSKHVYDEANAGRMGTRLLAIVVEGPQGRAYLAPDPEHERVAQQAKPEWKPELLMTDNPRWFSPPLYGLKTYGDIFTARQLVVLNAFSDLVQEAIGKCQQDAIAAGMGADARGLCGDGTGATAYAEAIAVYLAFAVSKAADRNSALCFWEHPMDRLRGTFGRQALPMVWDFAETNPLAGAGGDIFGTACSIVEVLDNFSAKGTGHSLHLDAKKQTVSQDKVICTDPPYYDNIGYADLSDFFYVWLRRNLKSIMGDLYATVAVPKADELVATPHRHGGKEQAEAFFLSGMSLAIHNLVEQAHPAFPTAIFYAFKQSETSEHDTSNTGWETFLDAVLKAGFAITGTWPVRTELTVALKKRTNVLASSIVLVCRKRTLDAATISRREFIRELNANLPEALVEMTGAGVNSPVAPVDLSQAMIGPGMAIFSKYSAVLESDGKPMSVRTALQLINRFLAEDDFDHDTQFCLRWFEGYGWNEGIYGEADVLARAKGTNVGSLNESGVVESGGGKIRLLRWTELGKDWTPLKDNRTPIWEGLHQMIRALNQDGESAAGDLLAGMPMRAEPIRALAYRLYTLCERKGWAEDARSYNELIGAWSAIERAANESGQLYSQPELF